MNFQWVPEITHHCQKTPFLLVGTQIDLRDDAATVEKLAKNKQRPVSSEQGEKLAKELKAVKYVECSALTQVIVVINPDFCMILFKEFDNYLEYYVICIVFLLLFYCFQVCFIIITRVSVLKIILTYLLTLFFAEGTQECF